MKQDSLLPLELPAVRRKKVSVAFDSGTLSSDAGVLLLRGVEWPDRIDHPLMVMLRPQIFDGPP